MFENFYGNQRLAGALARLTARDQVPQTILLAGPQGVGKATLARRIAAGLLGGREKIEQDDLNLPHNLALAEEREKWPAERRSEEPLFFASHPDFVTFPPDGPLRQISIQQMRLLKERARFKPSRGNRRVFLVDHLDRANEQAANSLLKTLEEPPDHLVLVLTAENAHDLLPTIRSRSICFQLAPLSLEEMRSLVSSRALEQPERRILLAAGAAPFSAWLEHSEAVASAREDKLEAYLKVLYGLLADLLSIRHARGEIRHPESRDEIERLAARVSFEWLRSAAGKVDALVGLLRRNIQKTIALDALILELRDRFSCGTPGHVLSME